MQDATIGRWDVDKHMLQRLKRRAQSGDESGFGLIEVIVSMGIFAAVTVGLLGGMLQATKTTFDNKQRSIAANLASQEMDRVRSTDVSDLPIGLTDTFYDRALQPVAGATTLSDASVAFQVQRRSEWVQSSGTPANCTGTTIVNGMSVSYLSVQVEISWPRMRGVSPVRSDTVVTPESARSTATPATSR